MNKETANVKIAEAAKAVFTYCRARTDTREEAEDLAQDILLELLKSRQNIRDDRAFYGFMWALAGNVYKNWCKKRARRTVAELDENAPDSGNLEDQLALDADLALLRRELSLLDRRYRAVTIAYYYDGLSVSEISKSHSLSESMVKYLLFKTRQILKGGMNMIREYGELSFNPRNLTLGYLGEGPNRFWTITKDKKIPQNILWACYNDSLTEEELSLQIGVAVPYLEAELGILTDAGLLIRKGGRYSTNVIIITRQLQQEIASKTAELQETIADRIYSFITDNEKNIRSIGFHSCGMSSNSFLWHVTLIILAYLFGRFSPGEPPVTAYGDHAFVWGEEATLNLFNMCNLNSRDGTLTDGEIRCLEYVPLAERDYNWLYRNRKAADVLVRLAKGAVVSPNDYEKEYIAELIAAGYAYDHNGNIGVTMPVYTQSQFNTFYGILEPAVSALGVIAKDIQSLAESILRNHAPAHLKGQVAAITAMSMLDLVISATVICMLRKDYLKGSLAPNEMPMMYILDGVFVRGKEAETA